MGKRSAQNELYNAYAPRMFTLCLRYSKNRFEAEEILQEGWIKVFTCLHQYRNEGSLEGWIRRIMITTALKRLRSRHSLHPLLPIEGGNEMGSDEIIESGLHAKELLVLIQSLPLTYRLVFNLYVFEGYQHKDIAQMLHISEGTSKSNLYDARQWLKSRIKEAYSFNNNKRKCL